MTHSLAIDHRPGSFSDRWVERAKALGVRHELVDCLEPGILSKLRRHDALLWHFTHSRPADLIAARSIIRAAEGMGLVVFPSTDTCWSFDDKIAQKYQLEAVGAPLAQTDCFFSEDAALAWIERAQFPRVVKLRGGAGSTNVRLVSDAKEARAFAREAFGRGMSLRGILPSDAGLRLSRAKARRDLVGVLRRAPSTLAAYWRRHLHDARERGYIYFQEFLPGNEYDIRVTVIGHRAFAFTRNVRPHDFRASGSGRIDHSLERVPLDCNRIAFETAAKLRSQSAAFDFVLDRERNARILEVSFGFLPGPVHDCPGYWDRNLAFVEGHFWPQDAILDDLLSAVARRDGSRVRPEVVGS